MGGRRGYTFALGVIGAVIAIFGTVAVAQTNEETPLLVAMETTANGPLSRVEGTAVDCSKVGEFLKAMRVLPGRHVHIRVAKDSTYEAVVSLLQSVRDAGVKIGFVNGS